MRDKFGGHMITVNTIEAMRKAAARSTFDGPKGMEGTIDAKLKSDWTKGTAVSVTIPDDCPAIVVPYLIDIVMNEYAGPEKSWSVVYTPDVKAFTFTARAVEST